MLNSFTVTYIRPIRTRGLASTPVCKNLNKVHKNCSCSAYVLRKILSVRTAADVVCQKKNVYYVYVFCLDWSSQKAVDYIDNKWRNRCRDDV